MRSGLTVSKFVYLCMPLGTTLTLFDNMKPPLHIDNFSRTPGLRAFFKGTLMEVFWKFRGNAAYYILHQYAIYVGRPRDVAHIYTHVSCISKPDPHMFWDTAEHA